MTVEMVYLKSLLKISSKKFFKKYFKKMYLFIHIKSSSLSLSISSIFIIFKSYFLSCSSNILITRLTLDAVNSYPLSSLTK